jgi:hypothetical protein
VRPWLAAIWLTEKGVSINAFKFHNLVGIGYSSAWRLLNKLWDSETLPGPKDEMPAKISARLRRR